MEPILYIVWFIKIPNTVQNDRVIVGAKLWPFCTVLGLKKTPNKIGTKCKDNVRATAMRHMYSQIYVHYPRDEGGP
jgi:hypothetical protein